MAISATTEITMATMIHLVGGVEEAPFSAVAAGVDVDTELVELVGELVDESMAEDEVVTAAASIWIISCWDWVVPALLCFLLLLDATVNVTFTVDC